MHIDMHNRYVLLHHRSGDLEKHSCLPTSSNKLHHRSGDLEIDSFMRFEDEHLHHRSGDLESVRTSPYCP